MMSIGEIEMKKIPEEIKDLIIKLRNKGFSIKDITERSYISESSVNRILKENNVKKPQKKEEDTIGYTLLSLKNPNSQLIFNLNRIAKECETDLSEFLTNIARMYNEILKITSKPSEFYYFLIDLCCVVFKKNFDEPEIVKSMKVLVNQGIYLFDIHRKIDKIKEKCNQQVLIYKLWI